jgi:hypothetical protein
MSEKELDAYPDGEKPLVFHYNRAERLASAPQNVRDYYAGKNQMPKGLFKVLVASKFSRIMLVFVVLFGIVAFVLTQALADASSGKIGGIQAAVSAFSFDGGIYVSIELNPASTGFRLAQTAITAVPVTAGVDFLGSGKKPVRSSLIEGIYAGKQEFLRTTTADYDIMEIVVLLCVGDESLTLTAKVIRK